MKTVLIASYYFPPHSHSGVFRPLKFAQYLPENGYHPVVVTCGNMVWDSYDFDMYRKEVSGKIEVHKIDAVNFESIGKPFLSQWCPKKIRLKLATLLFEDRFDWALSARSKAKRIAHRRNVDVIYTTGPPQSVHFLGLYLKTKLRRPWVIDFRDPFVTFSPVEPTPKWKYPIWRIRYRILFRIYEYLWVRKADKVIAVTQGHKRLLQRMYPQYRSKFTTITNGFDESDFTNIEPAKFDDKFFTIVFTGRFYMSGTQINFLEGLRLALFQNRELRNKLRIRFIGFYDDDTMEILKASDIDDVVSVGKPVGHHDAIRNQLGSDANLLFTALENDYAISGKFYEYIRAGRPILAVSRNQEIQRIIQEQKLGIVVDSSDIEQIAYGIITLVDTWGRGVKNRVGESHSLRHKYDRRNLTVELANVFDELTDAHQWR